MLLSQLEHRNIVRYMGCRHDKTKKTLNIFLEYVGGSISSLLDKYDGLCENLIRVYTK